MKTLINIKVDSEVKEASQEIANSLGVPLSVVVNAHLREFIRTRAFSVSLDPELKDSVMTEILARSQEYKENSKKHSTRFTTIANFRKQYKLL